MQLNNSLKKYLHELRMEKKQKRRLASFITAMSVFVSTGVFWQLRGIGTAMTDETPSLNGTDTAAALSAPDGSLCETNEIWESTLPELTDTLAENAALIAASQLGYTENEQNYTLGDDGCTHKNYSRYGAWFGNPYGDWNNMFTCFCLHYAGVNEADIPLSSGCWAWSLKLNEKGVLSPLNRGSPKRGDVLLFDTDLDGKADRSGIISDVAETCFITIEGQVDGAVAECRHSPDDEHIIGYVPVETPENENVSLIEFSAESESGIKVAASAELGVFPDGTEMLATDIPRDEALGKAADALGTGTDEIEAVAVDISFLSPDGVELEPTDSSAVHVEITLPEEQKLSGDEFSLIHISDSGGTEIIENAEVSENGAEFDAERFSIYVVTATGSEKEKDKTHESLDYITWFASTPGNPGFISNSPDKPYIIKVGDTITLAGYSRLKDKWFYYDSNVATQYNSILQGGAYDDSQSIAINGTDGSTYYKRVRDYTARSAGDVVIKYQFSDSENIRFYVRVLGNVTHNLNFSSIINDENALGHSREKPYILNKGDTVVLSEQLGNIYFYNNEYGGYRGYFYSMFSENDADKYRSDLLSNLSGGETNGYRTATFTALINDGSKVQPVSLHMLDGSYQTIYFKVQEMDDSHLTHADIEIDDGGTYKITRYKFETDGSYTETITSYDAHVKDVNDCKIFNSNQEVISHFNSSHYYHHGTVGTSQYELTSNYIRVVPQPEKKYDSEGHVTCDVPGAYYIPPTEEFVYIRDDPQTNFYLLDTDTARFDVKLLLVPKTETENKYNNNGEIISYGTASDVSGRQSITLDSVIFNMNHKSVIDAHNKCPAHTGLDFTLAANAVMVDFQMKKEFVGGDISSSTFEFQLLDENGDIVATANNDANGIISFSNIYFNKEGTYNYTVRELNSGDNDIIFANDRTVTITVNEQGGLLNATISVGNLIQPLINYKTYTLPSTGGSGVVPYMITGSAIIILSFAALLQRKRKEDK